MKIGDYFTFYSPWLLNISPSVQLWYTCRICDQPMLRRDCASKRSIHLSIRCSHIQGIEIDEGPDQTVDTIL